MEYLRRTTYEVTFLELNTALPENHKHIMFLSDGNPDIYQEPSTKMYLPMKDFIHKAIQSSS